MGNELTQAGTEAKTEEASTAGAEVLARKSTRRTAVSPPPAERVTPENMSGPTGGRRASLSPNAGQPPAPPGGGQRRASLDAGGSPPAPQQRRGSVNPPGSPSSPPQFRRASVDPRNAPQVTLSGTPQTQQQQPRRGSLDGNVLPGERRGYVDPGPQQRRGSVEPTPEPPRPPSPPHPEPPKDPEKPDASGEQISDDDSRIDLTILWPPTDYTETLLEAYGIYAKTMHIFFRYPIFLRRDPDDGAYVLKYQQFSLFSLSFVLSSVFLFLISSLFCANTVALLLNIPPKSRENYTHIHTDPDNHTVMTFNKYELRSQELYIFQRNLVPVIILICFMIHISLSNLHFFKQRHILAAYYTFWFKAVELMKIDAAFDLVFFMRWFIFAFMGFLLSLIIMAVCRLAPVTAGAPSILACVTLRLTQEDLHLKENFWFHRTLFGFIFLYILISAKTPITLFIFTSKLLSNCILVWNNRLDRAINRGERYRKRVEKHQERIGFDHLFKDYVVILDLMEGADVIFAGVIESFYATHVISIIFELFYLYQCMTASVEFELERRRLDVFVMFIFVLHSIVFLYVTSISGSDVAENSLDGLDIIRRKALLGRKSDEELYMIISLYMSYTGHFDIGINASKMFTFNKSFLISMFILAFTFFIIVLQFSPLLMMTDRVKLDRIRNKIPLQYLEELVEGYYSQVQLFRLDEKH